jgi:hypothetical protein
VIHRAPVEKALFMAKPFFHADQVGSLLRPPGLVAARQQFQQGQISKALLRQQEDAAIAAVVKRQEACGFDVVVDGEFRRENWWIDFVQGLSGVEIRDGDPAQAFVAPGSDHDHGWKYVPKNVVTTARLSAAAPITAPHDCTFMVAGQQSHKRLTPTWRTFLLTSCASIAPKSQPWKPQVAGTYRSTIR